MSQFLRAKALYFLSRREYGYRELADKLKKYTTDEQEITLLLQSLQECGYLSEQRYVEAYVARNSRCYGVRRMSMALHAKGVDDELISAALSKGQIDEYQVAYKLWQRKFKTKATDKYDLAKQIRFLQNKGFGYDVIKKVLNTEEQNEE